MNRDFVEMLSALSEAGADFLVVGAHALAAHGIPRATGDIDIWIRPTSENAQRVHQALAAFGAPLFDLSVSDLSQPGIVFQIGVPPSRIDILTGVTGLTFDAAWPRRISANLMGLSVPIIRRDDFLANKRATGRDKDLADIALLSDQEETNTP